MQRHFVYAMDSDAPAPASGGKTGPWFFHYKWDVDGEAFVPFPEMCFVSEANDPSFPVEGDVLWFVLDRRPIGYAPVLRSMADELNHFVEVYYDTRQIRETTYPTETGYVSDPTQRLVLAELKQFVDDRCPPRPVP
jgi:hypothetical protein